MIGICEIPIRSVGSHATVPLIVWSIFILSPRCPTLRLCNAKNIRKWFPVMSLPLYIKIAKIKFRYLASDPTLVDSRLAAKRLCRSINDTIGDPQNFGVVRLLKRRSELLESLFGHCVPTAIEIEPPFWCDYGYNISIGKGFYCNYNCCILGISVDPITWLISDCAKVTIGDRVPTSGKSELM